MYFSQPVLSNYIRSLHRAQRPGTRHDIITDSLGYTRSAGFAQEAVGLRFIEVDQGTSLSRTRESLTSPTLPFLRPLVCIGLMIQIQRMHFRLCLCLRLR